MLPLPMRLRFWLIAQWRKVLLLLMRYVLGLRINLQGQAHLQDLRGRACVILCKHQSAWETVALQQYFWPCVFVLKRELFLIPGLGWGLWALGMIGIDRKSPQSALQQVSEQGKARLQQGINVVIFPEGTRMPPGEKRRFQTGGATLAAAAMAPVLPVAHNAGELWPKNAFVKHAGTITLSFGPVIEAQGLSAKAINAQAEAWIDAEMQRITRKLPDH